MLGRLHHHISYVGFERWADHVNWDSVSLIATGAGTLILALGVVLALFAFRDARKTRDGELVIELSQRWNERETIESRRAYSAKTPDEITNLVKRLYPEGTPEQKADTADVESFEKLVRWPALMETIGVLRDHGAISSEAIFKMWGYSIASAWENWKDAAYILRERAAYPGTFEFFQDVAEAMQKQARKRKRKLKRRTAKARKKKG